MPRSASCTINKTKSSSSCLQLELVLFYYLFPVIPGSTGHLILETNFRPDSRSCGRNERKYDMLLLFTFLDSLYSMLYLTYQEIQFKS